MAHFRPSADDLPAKLYSGLRRVTDRTHLTTIQRKRGASKFLVATIPIYQKDKSDLHGISRATFPFSKSSFGALLAHMKRDLTGDSDKANSAYDKLKGRFSRLEAKMLDPGRLCLTFKDRVRSLDLSLSYHEETGRWSLHCPGKIGEDVIFSRVKSTLQHIFAEGVTTETLLSPQGDRIQRLMGQLNLCVATNAGAF